MVIPTSLIPTDEKKSVDKKKIAFAVVSGSMFMLPLALGLTSGLSSMFAPPLSEEKIFAVGIIAAYKCQLKSGRISPQEGNKIFSNIAINNNLDSAIFSDPEVNTVASEYARTLNSTCSATAISEKKEISRLYHAIYR